MLARFADRLLRARLARSLTALDDARRRVRVLEAEKRQARAEAATNYALAQRWRLIAHRHATQIAELRAQHNEQETTP